MTLPIYSKPLKNWQPIDFYTHITSNHIDDIYVKYSNPEDVDGIRISAFVPSTAYKRKHGLTTIPCKRTECIQHGAMMHLQSGNIRAKYKCERCGLVRGLMYRRTSGMSNARPLYFNDTKAVRSIATQASTYYHTLPIFDKSVIDSDVTYADPDMRVAYTLGIDVDLVGDHIVNTSNRDALSAALDIIREELDTFIPNSYNIQTSGNGLYVMIHHALVTENISDYMSLYNALIIMLDSKIKRVTNKVKLDDLNDQSRVFKSIFSIHQRFPLIAIPLEHDVLISGIDPNRFKLKNFDMSDYIDDEGNVAFFYNRVDKSESKSLWKRLNEPDIIHGIETTHKSRKRPDGSNVVHERRWDRRGEMDGVPYYHGVGGATEIIGKSLCDPTERINRFTERAGK